MASIAALRNRLGGGATLAALLIVGVLGYAAYAVFTRSPEGTPGNAPIAPVAAVGPSNAASASTTMAGIGSPMDPLPDPLPLSPDSPDATASTLAGMVSGGGIDALPALLSALRTAGITVYAPDNTVAVAAEGPDQGLYFEAWQVRSMAGVVGHKHVSVPLAALQSGLIAAIPALQNQPVARLLADGIARSAEDETPSTRFWARFIIELGKRPHAYQPYDLLGQADVATVRLDAIQLALIAQRLAADLDTAAGTDVALETPRRSLFSMPAVYADEPCRGTGPKPQPKVTQSVFGQVIAAAKSASGRIQKQEIDPYLKNLADYQNLIMVLNAVTVDVEMADGSPLKRTKTTTAGEQRKIRATVSLDGKLLEWDNCYRAWLNSKGRDYKWPPPRPGPIAGATVNFDLDGRGIVRIPSSAPASERGLPDATKTDAQGIARLAVEGEPQLRDLRASAKERRKAASTQVSVTLKLGDLIKRRPTEGGPLEIALVSNWVFDQELTLNVPYPFEVMDWSDRPGQWSGTMSVVETNISGSSSKAPFDRGATSSQETTTTRVEVKLGETLSEHGGTGVNASVKGRIQGVYSRQKTHASWILDSCGPTKNRRMNNTSRESEDGSADANATISISVFEDGTYLAAASSEMEMPIKGQVAGELEVFRGECAVTTKQDSRTLESPPKRLSPIIQVSGKVDPKDPDVLTGSTTEDAPPVVVSEGTTARRTKTTTWNLRRD